MRKQVDVVIVGGAITGSILALALSSATHNKIQIAIVEKTTPNYEQQGGFDARAIALAQGSLQKLAHIQPLATAPSGNLKDIICQFATPIQQIHVSDQHHFGKTSFSSEELNLPQLGAVVELAILGRTLATLISQQPNITLFCPDQVVHIERTQQCCSLTLASNIRLDCTLMIAADGIHSQIAEQCGVATHTEKSYEQSAIIANVMISEPHKNQAFERFTIEGPFALLPLQEKTMSLVWCVNEPNEIIALSDEQFLSALQQQFGWKLGRFLQASKRFVYPLSLKKAQSHIHHRLAIVGNAAQLLHPVAGQGFNLGMRDIYQLSMLIRHAFNQQQDIGSYALLSQFEQQRQADQQRIITATSGLISLFSCDLLPLQIIRNISLGILNQNTFLRHQIAHQALGW